MRIEQVRLRIRDSAAENREVEFAPLEGGTSLSRDGLELRYSSSRDAQATTFSAMLTNRGAEPITLDWCAIVVATGFEARGKIRFFKHGYQSWSKSAGAATDASGHPRDSGLEIIRSIQQSEATRPAEFPEASLSELFTILEQSGRSERLLVGFASAAVQFGTISVCSPARVVARALLDGVTLGPGESMQIEPLLLMMAERPAAMLATRYAERLGRNMAARIDAPYQRGWCSWYHYFHDISEDALRANIAALTQMREWFPLDLIQLDDGYQRALGDWEETNARFPGGLKRIAGEITAAGFAAGIWTAPFLAARDSQLMTDHPEWVLRHASGHPLRAAYNPKWTSDQDAFAYALDPGVPAFREHLQRLFNRMVTEFGFSYLKLDFLYAAAGEGIRHDPNLTRAQTLRAGLQAIRDGAGERSFILGCGCPLGPAIGIVDGMRIGPDVAPYWRGAASEFGAPSTADALLAIVNRSFMHRRLWLNDPDCLMLRRSHTELSLNEQQALARTIGASGGMLLISDDMKLLGAAESAEFKAAAEMGIRADGKPGELPLLPEDLLGAGELKVLRKTDADGELELALNLGDNPASFTSPSAGEAGAQTVAPRSAIVNQRSRGKSP